MSSPLFNLSKDKTVTVSGAELRTPRHVAIIMDGNGRWAKKRLLPRALGHRKGVDAVESAIKGAIKGKVEYLTLYAFSSENWNRPAEEVDDLMGLLRGYLRREVKRFHEEGIRLRVIGRRSRLPEDIVSMIEEAETLTSENNRLTVVIALSYGGRDDLVGASQRLLEKIQKGEMQPEALTEAAISAALDTSDMPDPDLVIRTSGEQRLSNFLLWQVAYAEFLFVDTLWPDFGEQDMLDAIDQFAARDRRFGARVTR